MKLAPDGLGIVRISLLIFLVMAVLAVWGGGWFGLLGLLGFLQLAFVLYFFRDPERNIPAHADGLLLAPADGKVVQIIEVDEPLYLKSKALQVSIFLSPLNVHVNRIPVSGTVEFAQYVPGEYLVAWEPKASLLNERSEVGVRHASGTPVLFKQIAGFVARRIVYRASIGESVQAGNRYGIVKFGSRMDIIVPLGTQIEVNVGDKTVAGETILGKI